MKLLGKLRIITKCMVMSMKRRRICRLPTKGRMKMHQVGGWQDAPKEANKSPSLMLGNGT